MIVTLLSLFLVGFQSVGPASCFSVAGNRNYRNTKSHKDTGRTTSATIVAAAALPSGSNKEPINDVMSRNIFHDYDKPIVLMGCSSEKGREIQRLAESFLSHYYPDISRSEGIIVSNSHDHY